MLNTITLAMAMDIEKRAYSTLKSLQNKPPYVCMIIYGTIGAHTVKMTNAVTIGGDVSYSNPMSIGFWMDIIEKTGRIEAVEFATSTGISVLFADSWYRVDNNGETSQYEYDMNPSYRLDNLLGPIIDEALANL